MCPLQVAVVLAVWGAAAADTVKLGTYTTEHLPPEANKNPNIWLIIADDLGHNDVGAGFYKGNERTITPNLDRMAQEALELTDFYVFKYCAPTRGMIQSSRYPFHFGFYANQDSNSFGERATMCVARRFQKRLLNSPPPTQHE